jgi:hypothetical protein
MESTPLSLRIAFTFRVGSKIKDPILISNGRRGTGAVIVGGEFIDYVSCSIDTTLFELELRLE